MRASLVRTWVAIAVAAAAVLVVAVFAGRDFARDVFPACTASVRAEGLDGTSYEAEVDARLEHVVVTPYGSSGVSDLALRFDEKHDNRSLFGGTTYKNVRIVRIETQAGGRECTCGTVSVPWTAAMGSASPLGLDVYRVRGTDRFVVKAPVTREHRTYLEPRPVVASFRVIEGPARYFQASRIVSARNLPTFVVVLALGALGVALLRSRRAIAYATRLHTWTEAVLTPQGLVENAEGALLANVDSSLTSTRRAWPVPAGAVLVAPQALGASGLYRDMPVVGRGSIAAGGHARWAAGTMVRLRDARALAVISTLCTAFAVAARVLGG